MQHQALSTFLVPPAPSPDVLDPAGLTLTGAPDDAAWSLRHHANYLAAMRLAGGTAPEWRTRVADTMTRHVRKNAGRGKVSLTDKGAQSLRNGWNTELLLAMQLDSPELIQPANHWAPVQAYYAVQGVSLAWFRLSGANAGPTTHAAQRKEIGELFLKHRAIPYPFNMVSIAARPHEQVTVGGRAVSRTRGLQLAAPPTATDAAAYVYSALTATRHRFDEVERQQWLANNRDRRRRSPQEADHHDRDVGTITLVDYLYRLRLQANYADSEVFTSSGIGHDDPERFLRGLVDVVSRINEVFEHLIASRVGVRALDESLDLIRRAHSRQDRGAFHRAASWPDPFHERSRRAQ